MLASRRPYFSRLGTHLAIRLEMTALLPLSCRVQNVLVMPVLLLRLTLMSFLGRPPWMPSRFHILSMFSFCLALMAIAWQLFLLVH